MTSSPAWSTHAIELRPDGVVKRFRHGDRAGGAREWNALTLLGTHAPGLAPEPRKADLDGPEPMVAMSRLRGVPLRGHALDGQRVAALAEALSALHTALPPEVLDEVPPRPWLEDQLATRIRTWEPEVRPGADGDVAHAMDTGLAWLASHRPAGATPPAPAPVFGAGDGNLANYLWDGSRVRIVDFEDSGRSDRALERAEITEHVSSWIDHPLDVPAFLGHFSLTPTESHRLLECRRLIALVWLFLLVLDSRGQRRNPPGTPRRQARRLLDLLG
jgi:hypothetical protein